MIDFMTDKRFIVGALAGAFVVPYVLKFVSLKMSARSATVAA
jgi:hypothetical protein